ncbi:hypothetical protein ACUYO0_000351 [Vibrio vulnificus]|uniref:hypothetical protein n=2 Tax=Vibrio TaxID=662 RepID=UPI00097E3FB5|nr:hypothetical protein [Vibrio vulnificus]MCA3892465.1 hypothetical protein [Vibrio vulnificus]MCU8236069.1 hypothetical protein [Vibrio vulnificus]
MWRYINSFKKAFFSFRMKYFMNGGVMGNKVAERSGVIKRAAKGLHFKSSEANSRAASVYGFSNKALSMSDSEIRDAWRDAASVSRKNDSGDIKSR